MVCGMTRPLSYVRERIIVALLKHGRFPTQRDLCVAAGLIAEPISRSSSALRMSQRTVSRLVKDGIVRKVSTPAKINNSYTLTPVGRAIAATLHSDAISPPKPRPDQQPQAPPP
jgi:hypothetical protein